VNSTSGNDLFTINADVADKVLLRGITFRGANLGHVAINITQVGSIHVERCSLSGFTFAGVQALNGGNLFVTGSDVRGCLDGVVVETVGAVPLNVVAQDCRFTECNNALQVASQGAASASLIAQDSLFTNCAIGLGISAFSTGSATGSVSNCTASLCTDAGFLATSDGPGNVILALTNCRATANSLGIRAAAIKSGSAIVSIDRCLVTQNTFGLQASGIGANGMLGLILGTSPGTNLIAGNGTDGSLGGSITLQ
jgi:hypothetical protein